MATVIPVPDPDPAGFAERLATALHVRRFVAAMVERAPFADLDELIAAADDETAELSEAEIAEALAAHPRIGERPAGAAHALSRAEQASADADDPDLARALAEGNQAYEERFGRIFLIRAAGRTRAEILAELRRRLTLDDRAELQEVGRQLAEIARLRLRTLFADEPGPLGPSTSRSAVTTHVLDTSVGRPAVGVAVRLENADGLLGEGRTDADGRIATIGPAALAAGRYRLVFDAGGYFAATDRSAFYPEVIIAFEITDPTQHHHLPLLLSPFGYTTYRGS